MTDIDVLAPSAEALAALRAAPTADDPAATLQPFVDYALEVVRGTRDDAHFVAVAAEAIGAARAALAAYVWRLDSLLTSTFEGGEWRWACERRSRIAAVKTLWADQLGGPGAPDVSVEVVDDLLQQKGQDEGYLDPATIPAGTPTSHWWWWYPAAPPASDAHCA